MYSSTYGDRYSAQWKALRALNVLDRLALGPTLLTPKNRSLNSNKSLKEYQVLATKKNFWFRLTSQTMISTGLNSKWPWWFWAHKNDGNQVDRGPWSRPNGGNNRRRSCWEYLAGTCLGWSWEPRGSWDRRDPEEVVTMLLMEGGG